MVVHAMAPVIVGRDVELRRIADSFVQAAEGRPQLLIVLGEAGIGKTWLSREAIARARAAGSHVLAGSCLDIAGGGLPYLPVAEALRGLARAASPEELERILGPARDDLAAIVPELAAVAAKAGGTSTDATAMAEARGASGPSDISQARLFERFIGVLNRLCADKPGMAVVDDVQWIDRASRDLLTFLVRNVTTERLVAILTCRMDDLPRGHPVLAWLAELSRAPGGERIELGRLDAASVGQMREAITGRPSRADETALLWRRSEGNPLFVAELLQEERLGTSAGIGRPASLVEILVARVAQLTPEAGHLVEAISVAGRQVDERLLALVAGTDEDGVARTLRHAIANGVLVVPAGGNGYQFRHELLREVVEQELLPGEARAIHERFAEALAERPELGDPSPAGAAAELAHHWARAGRATEAYHASIVAASAAEAVDAFGEALDHLERAIDLEVHLPESVQPSTAERLDVRRRAADVADLAGAFDRSIELTREALGMVDSTADPTTAGILHSRLGYLMWVAGQGPSAMAEHEMAVALVPEAPPSAERARVLASYGGALMGAGRYAESRSICEEAIACASAAGAESEESRARNMLGSDLVALGEVDAGLAELRQAREIAGRSGPPELVIVAYHNLALNLAQDVRFDEALVEARAGREAARRAGLERRFGQDLAALAADILVRRGRWAEADDVTREGLGLAQRRMVTAYLEAVRGRLQALRGDVEEASRRLDSLDRASIDPDVAAFVGQVRAETALAAGRPEDALAAVDEALGRLAGLDDSLWSSPLVALGLRALADLAEAGRAARDAAGVERASDRARPLVERAVALARVASTGSARAWLASARADGARIEGRADVAAAREAVDAWAAIGDAYALAVAQFRAAEAALRASGIRADVAAELRAAYRTAALVGARPLQHEIEGLAGRARVSLDAEEAPGPGEVGGAGEADEAGRTAPGVPAVEGVPGRAGDAAARRLGLSTREIEVLALVAGGLSNGEIAERLFITRKTAAVHVTHILDKLGVSNRVEAAMIAARVGLTGDDAAQAGT